MPAHAGEPEAMDRDVTVPAVYPRPRRGTHLAMADLLARAGLAGCGKRVL